MTSASAFSNDGQEVISNKLELDETYQYSDLSIDIDTSFEIDKCVAWVNEGGFKNVKYLFLFYYI